MRPRVLFVDDETEVIAAIRAALRAEPFDVVAATSAEEAFALLDQQDFQVVVSDEEMPDMKGTEFLARVQTRHPNVVRIMLSGRVDVAALARAVNDAQIFRFLAKPVPVAQLSTVLKQALEVGRVAAAHRAIWRAAQAQHAALAALAVSPESPLPHVPADLPPATDEVRRHVREPQRLPQFCADRLSAREREIVEAMATGMAVKEIARSFSLSTHTVRNHLKAVYRKLNVRSQLELLSLIARTPSTAPPPI